MAAIACRCGLQFDSTDLWDKHYGVTIIAVYGDKPTRDQRRDHNDLHRPSLNVATVREGGAHPRPMSSLRTDSAYRLQTIHQRIVSLRQDIVMLEMEESAILKDLPPQPIIVHDPYGKSDISVKCRLCGTATRQRFNGMAQHKVCPSRNGVVSETSEFRELMKQLVEGGPMTIKSINGVNITLDEEEED